MKQTAIGIGLLINMLLGFGAFVIMASETTLPIMEEIAIKIIALAIFAISCIITDAYYKRHDEENEA